MVRFALFNGLQLRLLHHGSHSPMCRVNCALFLCSVISPLVGVSGKLPPSVVDLPGPQSPVGVAGANRCCGTLAPCVGGWGGGAWACKPATASNIFPLTPCRYERYNGSALHKRVVCCVATRHPAFCICMMTGGVVMVSVSTSFGSQARKPLVAPTRDGSPRSKEDGW